MAGSRNNHLPAGTRQRRLNRVSRSCRSLFAQGNGRPSPAIVLARHLEGFGAERLPAGHARGRAMRCADPVPRGRAWGAAGRGAVGPRGIIVAAARGGAGPCRGWQGLPWLAGPGLAVHGRVLPRLAGPCVTRPGTHAADPLHPAVSRKRGERGGQISRADRGPVAGHGPQPHRRASAPPQAAPGLRGAPGKGPGDSGGAPGEAGEAPGEPPGEAGKGSGRASGRGFSAAGRGFRPGKRQTAAKTAARGSMRTPVPGYS